MKKDSLIYVSGHSGMVGSALLEELGKQGYRNILTSSSKELNLINQTETFRFFENNRPEYVFHLAAKVGGINGNRTYPADFTYENLQINTNVIHAAHRFKVKKLINFGSICIYPKFSETPVKEEYLLTGKLENTNEGYAIAKIAGLMLSKKYYEQYNDCFISVMPDNIYGIKDNFHKQNAHVISMLMERFYEAKINNTSVTVWGTGKPTRGFIYSKDVASGLIFIMNNYNENIHINLSNGTETSVKDLVEKIKSLVGYNGEIIYDTSKPDGTPKRYLDNSKLTNLGWKPDYDLDKGLKEMYSWFLDNYPNLPRR